MDVLNVNSMLNDKKTIFSEDTVSVLFLPLLQSEKIHKNIDIFFIPVLTLY